MGEITLGKRIEQSRVSISIAAKMLAKMRANQKRYYENRRSTHPFKVGDLVLLRKHNNDKLELKWEPNYRIVKLPSAWSAVVENQLSRESKRCNIDDLKPKHPSEDWELNPAPLKELPNLLTILTIYLTLTSQWINLLIIRQALNPNII